MSIRGDLSEQETTAILGAYDLGKLARYAYIERGYVNDKWLVEAERGLYLLKRRHTSLRKLALVQAQHALVRHLRRQGFPAPALVRSRSGNTFLVHGGEVYEMQEYVPGAPFDVAKPAHLTAAARMLGAYHNAVRGFGHPALQRTAERYGAIALSRIVKALLAEWRPAMMPEIETQVRRLDEHLRDLEGRFLELTHLPGRVIHGDYHGANLVFQEQRVVAVVDYDLAHWCTRVLEVAEAIIAFCTDDRLGLQHVVYPGALDLELVGGFVTAYVEEAPLSEAEIGALPDMLRTIWLCASLDPPLEPPLILSAAHRALPEILTLAEWARSHAAELVEVCLAAREEIQVGRDPP